MTSDKATGQAARADRADLAILTEGPQKGYVVRVLQAEHAEPEQDKLLVQLLDCIDGSTKQLVEKGKVILARKRLSDLAFFRGLDASAIEQERAQVDFERLKPGRRKSKKSKKQEDPLTRALLQALGKLGLEQEALKILEGGGE